MLLRTARPSGMPRRSPPNGGKICTPNWQNSVCSLDLQHRHHGHQARLWGHLSYVVSHVTRQLANMICMLQLPGALRRCEVATPTQQPAGGIGVV